MTDLFFYAFSLLTVGCAALVVLNKNAVAAAMFLLVALVGVAGLFVLLDAALLAFVLLLVYAGAVVTLFLFIIMLLDTRTEKQRPFKPVSLVAATLGGALLVLGLVTLIHRSHLPPPSAADPVGAALKPYAEQLFTTYLLPVEIVGFLLLAAMLGVIALSRKHEPAKGGA